MENTYLGVPGYGVGDIDTNSIFEGQELGWVLMDPLATEACDMETESSGTPAVKSNLFEVNHGTLRYTKSVVGVNVLIVWCKEWHVGKVVSVSPESGYDSCGRILRMMYSVLCADGQIHTMSSESIKSRHNQFVCTPGLYPIRIVIVDISAPETLGAVQEEEDRALLFGHGGEGVLVYHRNVDPSNPISMSVVKQYEGVDRVGICVGRNVYGGSHGTKREFLYMVVFDDGITRLLTCVEVTEGFQLFSDQDRVSIRAVL